MIYVKKKINKSDERYEILKIDNYYQIYNDK